MIPVLSFVRYIEVKRILVY